MARERERMAPGSYPVSGFCPFMRRSEPARPSSGPAARGPTPARRRSSGTRTRPARRRSCRRSRPAPTTSRSVPVLARQRSCAAVPRMRWSSVPLRPATASDWSNATAASVASMPVSSRTTSRGVVRFERERPEPSTIVGAMSKRSSVSRIDGAAGRRRARAAELRAEPLHQRLGDVVVRRLVHLAHDRRDRRRAPLRVRRHALRRRARAGLSGDPHALALERLLERLGREPGRAGLEVRAPLAGAPVVERERAERADPVLGAGAQRAAERVERRLVADHAPLDPRQPGLDELSRPVPAPPWC